MEASGYKQFVMVAFCLVAYHTFQSSVNAQSRCSLPEHRFEFRCFIQNSRFTPRSTRRPRPPRPTFRSFSTRFRQLTPIQRLRISVRPSGRSRFPVGRTNLQPENSIRLVNTPGNFRPETLRSPNVRPTSPQAPTFQRRLTATQSPRRPPVTRPRPTFRQAPAPFRSPGATPRPTFRQAPAPFRPPAATPRPTFRQAPAPFRSPAATPRPTFRQAPAPFRSPAATPRPTFRQAPTPFRPPGATPRPTFRQAPGPVRSPLATPQPSFRRPSPSFRLPATRAPSTFRQVTANRRPPVTRPRPSFRQPVTRGPVVVQRPTPTRTSPPVRTLQLQGSAQTTNREAIGGLRAELQGMLTQNSDRIASWVQLGFHACVGGCDGCLDVTNHHNRGLRTAYGDLRNLQTKHANNVTLADLVVLAAVEAGNEGIKAATNSEANIPFRIGRRTCTNPDNPQKRSLFPEGDNPNAIQLLISEFSLQRNEAVALLGAHSLGRCRSENSGFQGPWDNTPRALDNGYYKSLQGTNWVTALSPGGKIQWTADRNNLNSRMMLSADMGLFKQITVSGSTSEPSCSNMTSCPVGPDAQLIGTYASNEPTFHQDFISAYVKMLEKSDSTLTSV